MKLTLRIFLFIALICAIVFAADRYQSAKEKPTVIYDNHRGQNIDLFEEPPETIDDDYHDRYDPKEFNPDQEILPFDEDEYDLDMDEEDLMQDIKYDSATNTKKHEFEETNIVTDFFFGKEAEEDLTPSVPDLQQNSPIQPSQATPNTQNTEQEAEEINNKPKLVNDDLWKNSLIFNTNQFITIRKAIEDFEKGGIDFDFPEVPQIEIFAGEDQTGTQITSPSIYLNSIVFFEEEKEDWKLWINGVLYTNANNKTFYEDEFAAVTLLNVEKNRVSFILDSISIETISPNWQGKLNPEAGGGYVSEDGVIRVSKDNRSIRFSLNVNQSFAVYDMAIVEGFKPSKKLQKRTQ